jgi:hypothetical protein
MKKRLLLDLECEENEIPFYVMNDCAQWYCGLRGGKAAFTDNFESARTLDRETQFKMLQRVSDYPIEKVEL